MLFKLIKSLIKKPNVLTSIGYLFCVVVLSFSYLGLIKNTKFLGYVIWTGATFITVGTLIFLVQITKREYEKLKEKEIKKEIKTVEKVETHA